MKTKHLFRLILPLIVSSALFLSCSNDNDDDLDDSGSLIDLPSERTFILNEGSWGGNNSNLTFYSPETGEEIISDIYYTQNGKLLGDLGQDIISYNKDMYITVAASKRLVKLNSAGVETASLSIPAKFGDPRYLAADDSKIYLTVYGNPGYVLKINSTDLSIEDSVAVGYNPENIAYSDDKLYVSNTGYGSGNTVAVINTKTFKLIENVEVLINPNKIIETDDDLYVISYGAYNSDTWGFDDMLVQKIDEDTHVVTDLGVKASLIAGYKNTVYGIYNTTPLVKFFTYNTKTRQVSEDRFLDFTETPELTAATFYMLSINPYNGDIYVSTTDYSTNGDVYHFRNDGSFIKKFESGGINPNNAVFFK
ncbi:MAG: hypothetical protein LBM07_07215 [Culturomica sp.]|jgi:hypothetical protein|nr:hypothetical protein [Culturomica sp.]